jgi:hypothetical protein
MDDRKSALIREIDDAFRGVTLGEGTSLADAMAIDYYPEGEVEKVRQADNGSNWTELPDNLIEEYPVIGFMDPEGFRHYHERSGSTSPDSAVFYVTCGICCKPHKRDYSRYQLFTQAQRTAIVHFLEFLCDEAWGLYSPKPIRRALKEYWVKGSSSGCSGPGPKRP